MASSPGLPTSEEPISAPTVANIPALDGLRGLAILGVLVFHISFFGMLSAAAAGDSLLEGLSVVASAGWAGVDLFFVLSGFLITRLLIASRGRDGYFRSFFIRRILRVFPAYFLVLALHYAVVVSVFPGMPAGADAAPLWLATYTANVAISLGGWDALPLSLQHFWSLAVEEQYYLLWPFVVAFVPRRHAMLLCGVLCGASLLLRLAMVGIGEAESAYVLTPARFDALAVGSWLAYRAAAGELPSRRTRRLLAGAGLAVIAAIALTDGQFRFDVGPWAPTVGLSCVAAVCLAFMAACLDAPEGLLARGLCWRPLRLLGRYSYGLYLWHQPVLIVLVALQVPHRWLAPPSMSFFLAWCVAAVVPIFGVTLLSYHLVELPFLRLKDRLAPAPARVAA